MTLRRIPDATPLSAPVTVTDAEVTVTNGSISLPATFQAGTDAYWLTLSPHGVPGPADRPFSVDGTSSSTRPAGA